VDYQVLFNLAVGTAGVFGGYVLNRIYTSLDKIDEDVRKIPLNYVQKDDFKTAVADIKNDIRAGFQQVDRSLNTLFERINEKADKA
jgi:isopropylmalate/homocitrate/citramalate synthase